MPLPPSASDTARRKALRVLYADRVIQETALHYGLRNSIAWEGEPALRAGTNRIFGEYEGGRLETTEAERASYVADVQDRIVPESPTNLSVSVGNQKLIVFFSPPANVTPTSYTVTVSPGGFQVTGTSSPIIVTGITNGVTYTVNVVATNATGSSSPVTTSVDSSYTFTTQSFTTVGPTTWTTPDYVTEVEYLVVGGGGGSGGGFDNGGGAGGAGGMVLSGSLSVNPGTQYTIIVGAGGTAGTSQRDPVSETPGGQGGSSEFNEIIALGGGGGFGSRQPPGLVNGAGGAAAINPSTAALGGNGGGAGGGGGGGGGSSGAGESKSGATAGAGGAGTTNSLSGSPIVYGIGGAGATGSSTNNAIAGTTNRGNGARGGGGATRTQIDGAAGGSGIVILRF
jgi:hypothetical protein